jgi:hypothetical protein
MRNPILLAAAHPSEDWREWLAALNDPAEVFTVDTEDGYEPASDEQLDHARRVLTRLASVTSAHP